ncbi:flagellar basal body L-ring protein FlgH [Sphingobium sp. DEHP117]|uniref:flagellar basal body L-ring protein FlgH n=1 Tax=Sphingobium sp. DEHP117 TaxID=2993436 RepID=UPI0027D6A8BC|nr:flagellar basal body L-ring protein FlgH [Sphingobium sp. DEHP117]MDQ4421120.1 flagellar basal body L-ring protein FlgH [Sphingobium sp. DEHP117]
MKGYIALGFFLALSACGTWGRLKDVGRAPKLSETQAPPAPVAEPSLTQLSTAQRGGEAADPPVAASASLFRNGAGALFQDQRASKVGDILTIRIDISDKASLSNATSRSRSGSEAGGASALFGLEKIVKRAIGVDSNNLVGSSTESSNDGKGSTARSETISMTMAAIVTAVLPNGNLVIKGRQESRVNFELRELLVSGIVRPQDVARDNSIRHTQIAEARISYGGKGQLTDAQQARWGQQLLDVLSPF